MSATPTHSCRSTPRDSFAKRGNTSLTQRWSALQSRADEIAVLADLGTEPKDEAQMAFTRLLANADERAAAIAVRGVEDMEVLVSMGLKALNEVEDRGQDPRAPALALWRELYHVRAAVLSVLEPVPA